MNTGWYAWCFEIGKCLFVSAIEHSAWGSEQTVYGVWG